MSERSERVIIELNMKIKILYFQAAMYYFVYYVHETNCEVLSNIPNTLQRLYERFRSLSENLIRNVLNMYEDFRRRSQVVSIIDKRLLACLTLNKGKHGS